MRLKNFQESHRLFKEGRSKTEIAKFLHIRKPTILKWLAQDSYRENRGNQKGEARKYTDPMVANRICDLKQKRIDTKKYFVGSDHIQMDYAKHYPDEPLPSTWFIQETVRRARLQTHKPKVRRKGSAEYLLYPVESIRRLGEVHESADFIGKKYIAGRTKPINIFSSSYYRPFKLYQIRRILAEQAYYAVECLKEQWCSYPIPNVFRIDNGLQFRGTASGKRAVGMFLRFLLNLAVTPLFGSPSKPWTNPHVEGHNRVFNEKVWSRHFFHSPPQIDNACNAFNRESLELFSFRYGHMVANGGYRYLERGQKVEADRLLTTKGKCIYFIRFVESFDHAGGAHIVIMNEIIPLPEQYNHQFVFAEWNLEQERLSIYSEYQKSSTRIKHIQFKLNL